MKRVLFATPNSTETFGKLWVANFVASKKPASWGWTVPSSLPVGTARNEVLKKAVEAGEEWVAWLDYDNIPPWDWVERLEETALKEDEIPTITAGVYFERGWPHYPVLGMLNENGKSYRVTTELPTSPTYVDVVGMGCVLVHLGEEFCSFLKDLDFQLFGYEHKGTVFGTEDIRAFLLLKENGFGVMVDPAVEAGHVGTQVVGAKHWAAGLASLMEAHKKEKK